MILLCKHYTAAATALQWLFQKRVQVTYEHKFELLARLAVTLESEAMARFPLAGEESML